MAQMKILSIAIPTYNRGKFLERALQVIKSYSLTRKKEQLVMAKLVDALGMTPQDLAAAVQRLKKYKIAKK